MLKRPRLEQISLIESYLWLLFLKQGLVNLCFVNPKNLLDQYLPNQFAIDLGKVSLEFVEQGLVDNEMLSLVAFGQQGADDQIFAIRVESHQFAYVGLLDTGELFVDTGQIGSITRKGGGGPQLAKRRAR